MEKEKHINVVAALQIGYSIVGLIIAGIIFALFYVIGDVADDHDAQFVLTLIANIIMTVSVILSLPGILAGIGLLKRKSWARILALIISVLYLFSFPVGTGIGVYSIWVLGEKGTDELFKG